MLAIEEMNLKEVVNCSGKMTYLGSSTLSDSVIEAMNYAAKHYFDMDDLNRKIGNYIGEKANAGGGCVTAGASAGVIIAIAAVVTQGNKQWVEFVPNVPTTKKKILLQKGHSISFGASLNQMVQLGGGEILEVGQVNKCLDYHLENNIDQDTAAILYVQSHHAVSDGMLSLPEVITIAKRHDIPVIVDAAAEEDIKKYISLGASLVIYSGAKAFSGPTSGCIVGEKQLIDWCFLQFKGVARPMKVGKENLVGLLEAIYFSTQSEGIKEKQYALLKPLEDYLITIPGIKCSYHEDQVGRNIVRLRVKVENPFPYNALDFSAKLKGGRIAVYTRDHHAEQGYIEFDPRPMQEQDIKLVIQSIEELMENTK